MEGPPAGTCAPPFCVGMLVRESLTSVSFLEILLQSSLTNFRSGNNLLIQRTIWVSFLPALLLRGPWHLHVFGLQDGGLERKAGFKARVCLHS